MLILHQESLAFFKNAKLHFMKWNGALYGPTIHNDTKNPQLNGIDFFNTKKTYFS